MDVRGDVDSQAYPSLVANMSGPRLFGSSEPAVSGVTPRTSILGTNTQTSRVVGGEGSFRHPWDLSGMSLIGLRWHGQVSWMCLLCVACLCPPPALRHLSWPGPPLASSSLSVPHLPGVRLLVQWSHLQNRRGYNPLMKVIGY